MKTNKANSSQVSSLSYPVGNFGLINNSVLDAWFWNASDVSICECPKGIWIYWFTAQEIQGGDIWIIMDCWVEGVGEIIHEEYWVRRSPRKPRDYQHAKHRQKKDALEDDWGGVAM